VGVVESSARFQNKHCMLVARAVVTAGQSGFPLRVFNPSDRPVTLYKHTVAACCVEAEVVPAGAESTMLPGRETGVESTMLLGREAVEAVPGHLMELYEAGGESLSEEDRGELARLLIDYEEGLIQHRIDTGSAHPVKQRLRRVPLHMKGIVKKEMQKLVEKGLIEPSMSLWASSLVLVKKKGLTKEGAIQYRVCIDYRPLNEVTVKDSYPTTRYEDCLEALVGSKWYCCMDLMSGYNQVEMYPGDKDKTAFHTEEGLYQWTKMSMGLANSAATFNRVLEQVLTGIPTEVCVIYIDDILVHAATVGQMFDRLRVVLERIKKAGLKFKTSKCALFKREVTFLGHRVSVEGVQPDPGKTKAIKEWKQPQCTRDVRSFLGLCGYYRRFVEKFADIARPLYKLTEKDREFKWTVETEEAFNELKERLCQAPILVYPDITKPFVLDCDASNEGLGAVLSQEDEEGIEHPVAYYARAFSKVEKRYCVTRRELLACVGAIRHFHPYLMGAPFVVRTDHNSLVWLCHFKEIDGQLARWLETLAQYDFKIIHRKGSKHGNADGLSRRSCVDCRHCEKAELMEYTVKFVQAAVEWLPYKGMEMSEGRGTCPNKEKEREGGNECVMEEAGAARGTGDAGGQGATLVGENKKRIWRSKEENQEGEQEVNDGGSQEGEDNWGRERRGCG
jgi:hypothetical protein